MKAILMTIKSNSLQMIKAGNKKVCLMTKKPRCDLPIDVYMCDDKKKVVGKFTLKTIDAIDKIYYQSFYGQVTPGDDNTKKICDLAAMSITDLIDLHKDRVLYSWYVDCIQWFEFAIDLNDRKSILRRYHHCESCGAFVTGCKAMNCYSCKPSLIKKVPQNFMYVEVIE